MALVCAVWREFPAAFLTCFSEWLVQTGEGDVQSFRADEQEKMKGKEFPFGPSNVQTVASFPGMVVSLFRTVVSLSSLRTSMRGKRKSGLIVQSAFLIRVYLHANVVIRKTSRSLSFPVFPGRRYSSTSFAFRGLISFRGVTHVRAPYREAVHDGTPLLPSGLSSSSWQG